MQRFAEKLRRLRLWRGLTLQQFASAIGYTTHGYISELETGKKFPTAEFVLRVARFYDISIDALLRDELDVETLTMGSASVQLETTETANEPTLPFIDRPPNAAEFERFRLALSTFQDGSGMLAQSDGRTLPGWRDFERVIAAVFNGRSMENKQIFDVLLANPTSQNTWHYGISCKMRGELDRVARDGRVTIELSNSSKKFKDFLARSGLAPSDYINHPTQVGTKIVSLVETWKQLVSIANGGIIDVDKSCYLALLYNRVGTYQLFWFDIHLPDPVQLNWYYPKAGLKSGHLNGDDHNGGRVFEWYSESGGQLKYYPPATSAKWLSQPFNLEALPRLSDQFSLLAKARAYFRDKWPRQMPDS
jgi:transcriptional regulator with XRE-family HTH domain